MDALKDGRDPRWIVYPARHLVLAGVLLFLLKLGSRRQARYQLSTEAMRQNLNAMAGVEAPDIPHPDTVDYFLTKLPLEDLPRLQRRMVRRLIRQKVLDRWRLRGHLLVAVDATGTVSFSRRHCPRCLTQQHEGTTVYYHMVLEAKIVTASGLAVSVMTEFVENPQEGADRQDCERRAFGRLAPRLKDAFPHMPLCMLLDGLYLCEPVLKTCRENGWKYVITFKEGSGPERWREYETLRELAAGNRLQRKTAEGREQQYAWVEGVPMGKERVNVVECWETNEEGKRTRFVWATNFPVGASTVVEVADGGGRLRWKIENEGFNEQKNGGYELQHAWSEDAETAQKYYALLQMAHLWEQLIEKGNLFKRAIGGNVRRVLGGVRKLAEYLKESLRGYLIRATAPFAGRIQVRLDSS